jgi:hypothetical protein
MFQITNTIYTHISTEVARILRTPIDYLVQQVKDRNPFAFSSDFRRQDRDLQKRIGTLKAIRQGLAREGQRKNDSQLINTAKRVNERIGYYKHERTYLHRKELAKSLLKCSSPIGLLFPLSGSIVRVVGHTYQAFNTTAYLFHPDSQGARLSAIADFSINTTLSLAGSLISEQIKRAANWFFPNC